MPFKKTTGPETMAGLLGYLKVIQSWTQELSLGVRSDTDVSKFENNILDRSICYPNNNKPWEKILKTKVVFNFSM